MKYKRLGNTGLMVSELSFGSWVTFSTTGAISKERQAFDLMKRAYENGVNFFDNAEAYANGEAETIMGAAVRLGVEEKVWTREDLVLSTKIFFGALPDSSSPDYIPNPMVVNRKGLSRKHIIEGTKASLKRMGLEYVDLVFCHRFDPVTPVEEVVRAFNFLIDQGLCFYWGTSEWTAQEIQEAKTAAARLGLVGPQFDQPQYNMLHREKVEVEYKRLYPELGLTIWSPLAYGILTGKYKDGVPEGSRLAQDMFKDTKESERFKRGVEIAENLRPIAKKLNCTLAQLALAWCMANANVSTVIGGATSMEQMDDNLKAVDVVDKLTPSVMKEISEILDNTPPAPRATQMVENIRLPHLRHFF